MQVNFHKLIVLLLSGVCAFALACAAPAPPPSISISDDITAIEGDEATVTISVNETLNEPLTVNLAITTQTTASPIDYRFNTLVVIEAGLTTKSVSITLVDDSLVEDLEFLAIEIVESDDYDIVRNRDLVVTIEDNDAVSPPEDQPDDTTANDQAPLTSTEVHDLISPAVAFVDTTSGSGSGLLIEGKYVLTAWHVVYPYDSVRVVFSGGEEHANVPVRAVDPYRDLAILGPLQTSRTPVSLSGESELSPGSPIFLLGYPAEVEDRPEPSITQGIVSRFREWDGAGLTILQADVTILGGQSGGTAVSDSGQVVGISNYGIGDEIALVNEIGDILPAIEALKRGDNPDGIGRRILAEEVGGSRFYNDLRLANFRDQWAFLLFPEEGDRVEIDVTGTTTLFMVVLDADSEEFIFVSEEPYSTSDGISFTALEGDDIIVVVVERNDFDAGEHSFNFSSSHPAISIQSDTEDGRQLSIGSSLVGNLDFRNDVDYFLLDLDVTQTVDICVDSFVLDSYFSIDLEGPATVFEYDDDSGGGFDNLNPRITFTAPITATYVVSVRRATNSLGSSDVGGYEVAVGSRCDDFLR